MVHGLARSRLSGSILEEMTQIRGLDHGLDFHGLVRYGPAVAGWFGPNIF